MLEALIFILLAGLLVKGLLTALANRPNGFKIATMGCGLFLAVSMTIAGICMWAEPELRDGYTLMFFLWAAYGIMIMVQAAKEK